MRQPESPRYTLNGPGEVEQRIARDQAIVAQAVLTAAMLASLGLAVASFTPRRAYATAAIFAIVIVPLVAVAALGDLTNGDLAGLASLFSPADVLEGANAFFYGERRAGPTGADLPSFAYVAAAVGWSVVATGALVARYRWIEP